MKVDEIRSDQTIPTVVDRQLGHCRSGDERSGKIRRSEVHGILRFFRSLDCMAWTALRISESIRRRCKVDGGVWWFGSACQLSAVLLYESSMERIGKRDPYLRWQRCQAHVVTASTSWDLSTLCGT